MSQANKDIVRDLRENAPRNPSMLDGLFTDDYVYHGIPMIGDLEGPNVFKKLKRDTSWSVDWQWCSTVTPG